jgi:hypothetical protein
MHRSGARMPIDSTVFDGYGVGALEHRDGVGVLENGDDVRGSLGAW